MNRLLLVAIPFLLALSACKDLEPPAQPIRPAQIWTVSAADIGTSATFSGEVQARYEADLAFRVSGKVKSRQVEVGQAVKDGQVLARLDATDFELRLASARAALAAAKAELARARRELNRLKPLFEQKFIGKSTLDAAQASYDAAQAQVKAARAQVRLSENQLAYAALKADRPGIITHVTAEPGQVIAAGTPVFRIAYDGEREVRVRVGESTATSLSPGTIVHVKLWSQPNTLLQGRVREVAPALDSSRSVLIKIALQDPPQDLRLGISAEISLPIQPREGRYWLPATALFQQGSTSAIWCLSEKNTLQLRPVRVFEYRGDGVLVSGIAPGQRVLAAGVHHVSEGQEVRPIPYDGAFKPYPTLSSRKEGEHAVTSSMKSGL